MKAEISLDGRWFFKSFSVVVSETEYEFNDKNFDFLVSLENPF